jgi:hypothetical protein
MKKETKIEKYIINPINNFIWEKIKYPIFKKVLKDYGMDWGKYGMEEIINMYRRHESEINRGE